MTTHQPTADEITAFCDNMKASLLSARELGEPVDICKEGDNWRAHIMVPMRCRPLTFAGVIMNGKRAGEIVPLNGIGRRWDGCGWTNYEPSTVDCDQPTVVEAK